MRRPILQLARAVSPGTVFSAEQQCSVPPTSCPRFVPTRGTHPAASLSSALTPSVASYAPRFRESSEIPDRQGLCTILHLDFLEFYF
jgi:hypothetical protein